MDVRCFRRNIRKITRPAFSGIRWRRHCLTLVACGLTTAMTGCASSTMSVASLNPFASEASTPGSTGKTPGMLVKTTESIGKAATGVGTATKNVLTKTTNTVGGWFGGGENEELIAQTEGPDDPLSLDNMPDQGSPEVFVANGQLWESTGNVTKAMESYTKALESEADHGPALTSIARLHFREENYPQAAQFFQKAVAKQPNDAALYNDLGLTLSKLGQHDMAAQTIGRALQLAPGTSRYANNLASVHFDAGRQEQALQVLVENNKPAVAHFNMAYLHYKTGQTTAAQQHLTTAMSFEAEAGDDPATKQAIERSREMLAQLSPGTVPGGLAPGMSAPPIPGSGPAAQIAAAPNRPSNPAAANPSSSAKQPTSTMRLGGRTSIPSTPVSYQDPRSFMSPELPAGAPGSASTQPVGTPSMTSPPTGPAATGPMATPSGWAPVGELPEVGAESTTPAAGSPTPSHPFTLPKNFQMPATQ